MLHALPPILDACPEPQASAFVVKLGCKAACMTAGVSPSTVDGMSAALGVNFLAGQKVNGPHFGFHTRNRKHAQKTGTDSLTVTYVRDYSRPGKRRNTATAKRVHRLLQHLLQ